MNETNDYGPGVACDPVRCRAAVRALLAAQPVTRQCRRLRGYGPGGEYCRTHAPAAQRAAEAVERGRMPAGGPRLVRDPFRQRRQDAGEAPGRKRRPLEAARQGVLLFPRGGA